MPPEKKEIFFSNPNRGTNKPVINTTPAYVELDITPVEKVFKPLEKPPAPFKPIVKEELPRAEGLAGNFLESFGKDKKVPIKAEFFDEEVNSRVNVSRDFTVKNETWFEKAELNPNEEEFVVEIEEKKVKPVIKNKKSKISLNASALESGDFGIFINNELVHQSSSNTEIEEVLQYLLLDEESPFPDLEQKDIFLVKRIPFKMGVHVD